MDLHSVVKPSKVTSETNNSEKMTGSLQSDAIFNVIKDRVAADPAKAKSVNGVFLYKITEGGVVKKQWSEYIQIALIKVTPLHLSRKLNFIYVCALIFV